MNTPGELAAPSLAPSATAITTLPIFSPVIDRVYRLDDIVEATRYVETGRNLPASTRPRK